MFVGVVFTCMCVECVCMCMCDSVYVCMGVNKILESSKKTIPAGMYMYLPLVYNYTCNNNCTN